MSYTIIPISSLLRHYINQEASYCLFFGSLPSMYKVLVFAYSVRHDQPPCYLAELLTRRQPNRRLRSASLQLLTLPASQPVTHGDRRFAVATLWNGLPDSVRTAKTQPQYKTNSKDTPF